MAERKLYEIEWMGIESGVKRNKRKFHNNIQHSCMYSRVCLKEWDDKGTEEREKKRI